MIVTNPLGTGTSTAGSTHSGWWLLLGAGIVSVVAGGIILSLDWSVGDLAVFVGAFLIVRGLLTAFSPSLDGTMRGWSIALGVLEFAIGIAVWVWPSPTLYVVAAWIGWYVLFSGVMTIAGSISTRDVLPYWGLALALGIVEVVLAFYLLGQPGITLVATVFAIGLWSILYGVVQILLSFEVKNGELY